MKQKLLIIFLLLALVSTGQTVNKKPITRPDTIYMSWNFGIWLFNGVNVLDNDTDPNGDSMVVTSYKIGTSTTPQSVDLLKQLKDSKGDAVANFMLTKEGNLMLLLTRENWKGRFEFTYIANDLKTGAGKSGKIVIIIVEGKDAWHIPFVR